MSPLSSPCLTLLALLLSLLPRELSAQERLPNLIVILADDLGVNDLGCYGRAEHQTPRLDQLAAEGTRFTSAYCAQPICSPSRAALLSGKHPARLHLTTYLPGRADAPSQKLLHPPIAPGLAADEETLAEILRAKGYAAACIGKWHVGPVGPAAQGFDFHHEGRAKTKPSSDEGGKGEYDLGRQAAEFIGKNAARPFFLYVPHNTPHIPLLARPELVQQNAGAFNPIYAAMMKSMDDTVGLIVDAVAQHGLERETLIVFASDNGGLHVLEGGNTPATHCTPFRAGKGYLYEGGLRVPFIMRWPGKIPAGRVHEGPVSISALGASFLEMAGLPVSDRFDDFPSIASLLLGRTEAPSQQPFYWHFPHYTNQGGRPGGAIRRGEWKLIEHYEDGRTELYDLSKDVSETTDVSAQNPERAAALRGELAAWKQSVKAQENSPNPNFAPATAEPCYGKIDTTRLKPRATAASMEPELRPWRQALEDIIRLKEPPTSPAGYIVLPARAAKIHGKTLRYEPEPQKETLGFWKEAGDWAEWTFAVPHPGKYRVEILQGAGRGSGGSEAEIVVGEARLPFTVEETGHFQRFVPRSIGIIDLPPGEARLAVRALRKAGPAVMDLRQITLTRAE